MEYKKLTEENIKEVVDAYVDYYNNHEDGCWTYEKAHKRIHQVMTIEGSESLVQYADGKMTGFVMGYYKEFDDLRAYYLAEIVIFKEYQNKGYGTAFLKHMENIVRKNDVKLFELDSVNDEHHKHFYKKFGFYQASNFISMGKFLNEA